MREGRPENKPTQSSQGSEGRDGGLQNPPKVRKAAGSIILPRFGRQRAPQSSQGSEGRDGGLHNPPKVRKAVMAGQAARGSQTKEARLAEWKAYRWLVRFFVRTRSCCHQSDYSAAAAWMLHCQFQHHDAVSSIVNSSTAAKYVWIVRTVLSGVRPPASIPPPYYNPSTLAPCLQPLPTPPPIPLPLHPDPYIPPPSSLHYLPLHPSTLQPTATPPPNRNRSPHSTLRRLHNCMSPVTPPPARWGTLH